MVYKMVVLHYILIKVWNYQENIVRKHNDIYDDQSALIKEVVVFRLTQFNTIIWWRMKDITFELVIK